MLQNGYVFDVSVNMAVIVMSEQDERAQTDDVAIFNRWIK